MQKLDKYLINKKIAQRNKINFNRSNCNYQVITFDLNIISMAYLLPHTTLG